MSGRAFGARVAAKVYSTAQSSDLRRVRVGPSSKCNVIMRNYASSRHIRMTLSGSRLPVTIVRPSGLTATPTMALEAPSASKTWTTRREDSSQMMNLPFSDPLPTHADCKPPALRGNKTSVPFAVWPLGALSSSAGMTITGQGKPSETNVPGARRVLRTLDV